MFRRREPGDFADEVRAHVELEAERLREEGLSEEEALAAARRNFGNVVGAQERFYDASRWMWLDHLRSDLRYAARQLRKTPGFTAVAILTVALGIGVNTAIFSLMYAVMFQPLPVSKPGQLYRLGDDLQCCVIGGYQGSYGIFSYSLYEQLRDHAPGFEEMAAFLAGLSEPSVRRGVSSAPAQALVGEFVSGNYFPMLGVGSYAGRLISPADDRPGAPPVAVLSYHAWRQRYGSDPSLVGSTLAINGASFVVSGIAAPSFYGETLRPDPPDIWFPLNTEPLVRGKNGHLHHPDEHWLFIIGRLSPGARPETAERGVSIELRRWLTQQEGTQLTEAKRREIARQYVRLTPASGGVTGLRQAYGEGLTLLLSVAGLVLVIMCANLANLLLARATASRVQNSVRLAIGAPRARLVSQALTESLLLALLGGAAGILVAFAASRGILLLAFRGAMFIPIDARPALPALAFALGVSLLTGIVFGLAPAWASTHSDPADALRGAGRSTASRSALPQRWLVVLQTALSLVLLSAAGLLTASLGRLEHQRFGFDTTGRVMVKVNPGAAEYTPQRLADTYRQISERLSALPGVRSVSLSLYSPMESTNWEGQVAIEGRASATDPNQGDDASWDRVGPAYFETIGTRLLRGRVIDERDTPSSQPVAVVNETFARRFFANRDPIGRHIGDQPRQLSTEIVGVVEDAKYMDADQPPHPMFFVPLLQMSREAWSDPGLARSNYIHDIELRVDGAPPNLDPAIRRALAEIDPNMTVSETLSFGEQLGRNFNEERLLARLTSLFGVLALLLASVGLYGVTSYAVVRRSAEIGVRMAFGASQQGIVGLMLRSALVQSAVGLAAGIPVALAAGRLLAHRLFNVSGYDPVVFCGASFVLAACALFAAVIPARRAARLDPMQALRAE
jgi:predicted permease